jgi:hypothetical protein
MIVVGLLILLAVIGGTALIVWQLRFSTAQLVEQLALLRRELGAGLGVNVDHPDGYLGGGHMELVSDYIKDLRRKERIERGRDRQRIEGP